MFVWALSKENRCKKTEKAFYNLPLLLLLAFIASLFCFQTVHILRVNRDFDWKGSLESHANRRAHQQGHFWHQWALWPSCHTLTLVMLIHFYSEQNFFEYTKPSVPHCHTVTYYNSCCLVHNRPFKEVKWFLNMKRMITAVIWQQYKISFNMCCDWLDQEWL